MTLFRIVPPVIISALVEVNFVGVSFSGLIFFPDIRLLSVLLDLHSAHLLPYPLKLLSGYFS